MKTTSSEMQKKRAEPSEEYGHKVRLLGNRCYRCKHQWLPRKIEEKPAVCPSCKSPYWDRPRKKSDKTRKSFKNGK